MNKNKNNFHLSHIQQESIWGYNMETQLEIYIKKKVAKVVF